MRRLIFAIAMVVVVSAACLVLATDATAQAKSKDKAKKKGSKGQPTYVFVDSTFAPQGTTLAEEFDLCDVRCANCHRRATRKRAGFSRYNHVLVEVCEESERVM